MIDVRSMQYLICLYEYGTVTAAAAALHISQPSLTNHLSRLENRLGQKLFLRSVKGLEPTPLGRELYPRCKQMLQEWTVFDEEINLLAGSEIGHLRIVCGAVIEQEILPNVLNRYLQHYPAMELSVDVISLESMLVKMDNNEADMAIGAFARHQNHLLQPIPCGSQRIGFYVRPQHPILDHSHTTSLTREHLAKFPFASPEIPENVLPWFATPGKPNFRPQLQASSYKLLKAVATSSNTCVAGPEFIFTEEIRDGTLVQLTIDNPPIWNVSIMTSRAASLSKALQFMSRLIEEEIHSLTEARDRNNHQTNPC